MNFEELQAHPNWSIKGYIDVTKTPEEIQRNNKVTKGIIELQEALVKDLPNRLERTPLKEVLEKEGVNKNLTRTPIVNQNEIRSILNKLFRNLKPRL